MAFMTYKSASMVNMDYIIMNTLTYTNEYSFTDSILKKLLETEVIILFILLLQYHVKRKMLSLLKRNKHINR